MRSASPRFDYGKTVPWVTRNGNVLAAAAGPDALEFEATSHLKVTTSSTRPSSPSRPANGWDSCSAGINRGRSRRADRRGDALGDRGVVEGLGGPIDVCGRLAGGRRALAHHAEGPDLRADGRHRRRAHDVAAGVPRRRPQLGLPLLLAAGRGADARRADGRRLLEEAPRWRDWLLRAVAGDPERPPDHVRARRRAPARRVRARGCPGYEGSASGARRQRRVGPAAARRLRRGDRRAVPGPRARDAAGARAQTAVAASDLDWLEAHWQRARRRHLGGARRPRGTSCTRR